MGRADDYDTAAELKDIMNVRGVQVPQLFGHFKKLVAVDFA